MKKMYEVELVNVNEENEITFSNSWGNESYKCETLEEAIETVNEYRNDPRITNDYDVAIINKLTINDDEETEESEHIEEYKL